MNTMHYLTAAFIAIWIVLAVYIFSLQRKEEKLHEEVKRLKRLLENTPSEPSGLKE